MRLSRKCAAKVGLKTILIEESEEVFSTLIDSTSERDQILFNCLEVDFELVISGMMGRPMAPSPSKNSFSNFAKFCLKEFQTEKTKSELDFSKRYSQNYKKRKRKDTWEDYQSEDMVYGSHQVMNAMEGIDLAQSNSKFGKKSKESMKVHWKNKKKK